MNYKITIILILTIFLIACQKREDVPRPSEEVYNFRDEKHQDFYSKFMRAVEKRNDGSITPNDSFERPFDREFIKKQLGIEHDGDINFRLLIDRIHENDIKYRKKMNIKIHMIS